MYTLIAIDGIDGSGKETQTRALAEHLRSQGHDVLTLQAPNYDTALGEVIKDTLFGKYGEPLALKKLLIPLFALDRHSNVAKLNELDADDKHWIVLVDRWTCSNLAYQGTSPEIIDYIRDLEETNLGIPQPALTIFIDLNPQQAKQGLSDRVALDKLELNDAIQWATYERYCKLSIENHNWRAVEATDPEGRRYSVNDLMNTINGQLQRVLTECQRQIKTVTVAHTESNKDNPPTITVSDDSPELRVCVQYSVEDGEPSQYWLETALGSLRDANVVVDLKCNGNVSDEFTQRVAAVVGCEVNVPHTVEIKTPGVYNVTTQERIEKLGAKALSSIFGTKSPAEQTYRQMLGEILDEGAVHPDRTGTGTVTTFGHQYVYNLQHGLPLLTGKRTPIKSLLTELRWQALGDTNAHTLNAAGCKFWDEWATEDGSLGPIYGKLWTDWECSDGSRINQLETLIEGLRTNPHSRRHIVTSWNPETAPLDGLSPQENVEAGKQCLASCCSMAQFYVKKLSLHNRCLYASHEHPEFLRRFQTNGTDRAMLTIDLDEAGIPATGLSCKLYQRSCDVFLGAPTNIASYSVLTMVLAKMLGHFPEQFIHSLGDAHIYLNHLDVVEEYLDRSTFPAPKVRVADCVANYTSLDQFYPQDLEILTYEAHPIIPAPVAV